MLVAGAVEHLAPKGFGHSGTVALEDGSADALRADRLDHLEDGATVITDA